MTCKKVPDSSPGGFDGDVGVERGWVYTVDVRTLNWAGRITSVTVVVVTVEPRVS